MKTQALEGLEKLGFCVAVFLNASGRAELNILIVG